MKMQMCLECYEKHVVVGITVQLGSQFVNFSVIFAVSYGLFSLLGGFEDTSL